MLSAFFHIAMVSPTRQLSLRRAAVVHIIFLCALGLVIQANANLQTLTLASQVLIAVSIVEASIVCGWRLTQMPKSQALEFMLTSPVQPKRLFFAEAAVGLSRFLFVHLAGLPVILMLCSVGLLQYFDIWAVFVLPFIWGVTAALGLTVWAYETLLVKRVGEVVAIVGVIIYLVVGVLAGEHLREWLLALPTSVGQVIFDAYRYLHDGNPFGVVAYWMSPRRNAIVAWEMMQECCLIGVIASVVFFIRAAYRLQGHFADRHYRPFFTNRVDEVARIGEQPLSWWAVKRVMEFSGRVNIWLAGGFSTIYAAYILAGDAWPPWMGRLVFEIFEKMGGVPGLVTGLVILAAVPAAFQYGLWDSSTQDRCRRLELLLLTELDGRDYWNASLAAALKRGRGYLFIAGMLWLALWFSGRIDLSQLLVSVSAGLLVWAFAFLLGFLAFSSGYQANGLGSFLTLGMPLIIFLVYHYLGPTWAMLFPQGIVYATLLNPVSWPCLIIIPYTVLAWRMRRMALQRCENDLRDWYDKNQGVRVAE